LAIVCTFANCAEHLNAVWLGWRYLQRGANEPGTIVHDSNTAAFFLIIRVFNTFSIVDNLKLNFAGDLAQTYGNVFRMAMRDRVDDRLLSNSIELCGDYVRPN
jgi:hypothetical protein